MSGHTSLTGVHRCTFTHVNSETGWRMGVVELRKRLASVLDAVESGRTLTITRDGRPVARLSPVARIVPIDEPAQSAATSASDCGRCGAALDPDGSCFACRDGA